jgi:hypothetical protein
VILLFIRCREYGVFEIVYLLVFSLYREGLKDSVNVFFPTQLVSICYSLHLLFVLVTHLDSYAFTFALAIFSRAALATKTLYLLLYYTKISFGLDVRLSHLLTGCAFNQHIHTRQHR